MKIWNLNHIKPAPLFLLFFPPRNLTRINVTGKLTKLHPCSLPSWAFCSPPFICTSILKHFSYLLKYSLIRTCWYSKNQQWLLRVYMYFFLNHLLPQNYLAPLWSCQWFMVPLWLLDHPRWATMTMGIYAKLRCGRNITFLHFL